MLPGPKYIFKCTNCDNLVSKESIISGNTFRAKNYSDGKTFAPMFRKFPKITKCKKCNTIFWLNESALVATLDYFRERDEKWSKAEGAEFLTVYEYFSALELQIAKTNEQEFYLRREIWWGFNDRARFGEELFTAANDETLWKENSLRLIELTDAVEDEEKIMLADLNRSLGNFDNCLTLINSIEDSEFDWIKESFYRECDKKNKMVFPLN